MQYLTQEAKDKIARQFNYKDFNDCNNRAPFDHKMLIVEKALELVISERDKQIAKLQQFKDYVHKRLDDAGVSIDPESPHKESGCRIGGRLDEVFKNIDYLKNDVASFESEISELKAEQDETDKSYAAVIQQKSECQARYEGLKAANEANLKELYSLREEVKTKDKEIISLKFQADHKPRKKASPFCDACGRIDCSCDKLRKH